MKSKKMMALVTAAAMAFGLAGGGGGNTAATTADVYKRQARKGLRVKNTKQNRLNAGHNSK